VNTAKLIDISPADTVGRFFDAEGQIAVRPSDLADARSKPDQAAIYSVLQFGAIVPPLTPWEGIERFMPGYRYMGTTKKEPLSLLEQSQSKSLSIEELSSKLERILDGLLEQAFGDGPAPAVLFSGGVDSGLIAARLAALGFRDTLLLNYSFSDDDPESELAEVMANHLGLKFERFSIRDQHLCNCLEEPGRVYSLPFSDATTAPASDFAHQITDRLSGESRHIFDGTGTGVFAMANRLRLWNYALSLPSLVRQSASRFYASALWHRDAKLELQFRILRRSATMPDLAAITARNPLAGIFYDRRAADRVNSLLEDWVEGWAGESLAQHVVASYSALTSAGIYAQNALPIFDEADFAVHYPYLESEMLGFALAIVDNWNEKERKSILKYSLARYVPQEMAYRPRSGFADPQLRIMRDPRFIDYLRSAADSTGPISSILRKDEVIKGCELLSRGAKLPRQTMGCLWAITFLDRWYRTVF